MLDLLLEIRTSAGAISGVTDKILSAELERSIDDIGRLRVSVPASEPIVDHFIVGRRAYLYYRGGVVGVGVVNERPTEVVTGGQVAVALDMFLLFADLLQATAEDSRWTSATALSTILGTGGGFPPGLLNGTGWTLNIEAGPGTVPMQYDLAGEDPVAAVKKVVDEAEDTFDHPLHWWADSRTKILYVGIFGGDSGLRLAPPQGPDPAVPFPALLVEAMEDRSAGEIVNSIDAWGGSAGPDRVLLPFPENSGAYTVLSRVSKMGGARRYLEDAASVAAYGLRRRIWHNNDKNTGNMSLPEAQNALYFAACTYLLRAKDEHRAWQVTARGSDLDILNPGDMVSLWYRGRFNATTLTGVTLARTRTYNGPAYITKIVRRWDAGGERYTLECGWCLDHKIGSRAADEIGRAIAQAVHAAGGPSTTRMITAGTSPAGGGAPANAEYLTLLANGTLTAERILTAGTGLTLTDGGAGLAATLAVNGASPNVVPLVVQKTGIADNVATPIFTVTTTNEAGDVDGGVYICHVRAAISHAAGSATVNAAVVFYEARFTRAVDAPGSGATLSTMTEIAENNLSATDIAERTITNVIPTVAATSDYVATFSLQIDLGGASVATAEVTAEIKVIWTGFLHTPVIAAA